MHSMSTSLEYQIEYRSVWIHFEAICETCILWQLHIWDQRYALWIISRSQSLCQLRPCTSAPSVWGWFCVSPIVVHSAYLAAGKGPWHTICGWNVQSLHSVDLTAKLWWCPFWFLSAIWHHDWLSSSSCFRICNRHSPRTQIVCPKICADFYVQCWYLADEVSGQWWQLLSHCPFMKKVTVNHHSWCTVTIWYFVGEAHNAITACDSCCLFFVFLGLAGTDTTVQSVVCGVFSAISYVISFSNANLSSDAQAYMLCTLVADWLQA